jgi:flavodoxin I
MKVLIIFDSYYGNTNLIALAIKDALEEYCDVIAKKYDEETIINLEGIDLLIVGSPTQHRKATLPIQQFLSDLKKLELKNFPTIVFDTRYKESIWKSGSAGKYIAKRIKKSGCKLIMPPESFFVTIEDGNLEEYESRRASNWAKEIGEKLIPSLK